MEKACIIVEIKKVKNRSESYRSTKEKALNSITEPYLLQLPHWPKAGKHILAQYDDESIIVYQAYRPAIGQFAARYGYFGGEFSLSRMSWIKPGFLWMMYRSGWSHKPGQEVILAIRLKRSAFDEILAQAVHSTFVAEIYGTPERWQQQAKNTSVMLQWDPDHDPSGMKVARRVIQLGLRGPMLEQYARDAILEIEDISSFVHQQYQYVHEQAYQELVTPRETVYPIGDTQLAVQLGVSSLS
jgi:hypothetical protein